MQAANTNSPEGISSSPEPSSHFEVSLVYQDLPTGLHARQFLNHVMDGCEDPDTEFHLTLWKLDLFHLPELCEQAVVNACAAGLVIMSLRGDLGLGLPTERWLTQWINRRGDEECALAVLIDCDMQRMDSLGQTLFWLQEATRSSQVRLFVGFTPSASAKESSAWKQESQDTELMLFTRDNTLNTDLHRKGGINE